VVRDRQPVARHDRHFSTAGHTPFRRDPDLPLRVQARPDRRRPSRPGRVSTSRLKTWLITLNQVLVERVILRQGDVPITSRRNALTLTAPDRRAAVAVYARPRLGRGLLDIATSVGPYLALCVAMVLLLPVSPWVVPVLMIPATGFLVRVFIMFHDCVHGSLLPSKRANTWAGTLLGLLVFAPLLPWRHHHTVHHATAGNLDRRGVGDVETWTVAEYRARPWRARLAYRMVRHPAVMFGVGPFFAMLIEPRLVGRGAPPRIRNSVLATDAALVALGGGLCWLIGWQDVVILWTPMVVLGGAVGIWLFYVQHQFENVYWQRQGEWQFADAALRGCSYLRLPRILQFFTGNIGLHHVHHFNARIPNYNLQRAHDANAIFAEVPTLSIRDGLRAVRFKLWDEDAGRLVTFAQARVGDGTGVADT